MGAIGVQYMVTTLLALMLPNAAAFAPTDETWVGIEPNLVQHFHPGAQIPLRRSPAWQDFLASDGEGWFARFDERTGMPYRAFGPGIPIGPVGDEAQLERSLLALFDAHEGLIGVSTRELALRAAGYVERTDTWYVDFDRMVPDGVGGETPIWRGGVTARVRNGELLLFGVETWPAVRVLPPAQIDEATAIDAALLDGPAPMADHRDVEVRQVALPVDSMGPYGLVRVYEVKSRTDSPLGHWVTLVDAATGKVVTSWNEIRFFSGTVYGTHDTRTVDGSMTTSPMPLLRMDGSSGGREYAGETGGYELSDGESWSAYLRGSYVTISNQARGGNNGQRAISGSTPTWTTSDATQAEIDSYKFLHDVRTWGRALDPEVGIVADTLQSRVNISSTCNAYYDGNVNFYSAGGGCNNTGQIADVNYHEWGHGFHYTSLEAGSFDGSLSEGVGDAVSSMLTHDNRLAPYFYTSGGAIRDVATNYVYPDDVSGEVHQDGLIFAGAVWDVWESLYTQYGETRADEGEAWSALGRMFADALKAGPTIPQSYDDFVLADDNDNDPTNGTPHICAINEGFGLHGLGPGGTEDLVLLDHLALGNQPERVSIRFDGALLNLAPDCNDFTLASAEVVYTTDGGTTWATGPLAVTGEAFDGTIPGLPAGTVVNYYIRGTSTAGSEVTQPVGGEIAPYSFYVGGLEPIYCTDFEADDGDFSHELLSGSNREGADDWQWGSPNGEANDPVGAYSGTKVWGNDLGADNYNGEYQSNIHNRLESPPIDIGDATTVVVQFRRWLAVEDGDYDHARFLVDEREGWSNFATGGRGTSATEDGEWKLHTTQVSGVADAVVLAWEMQSDGDLEYGGWNIDDLCVYQPVDYGALFGIDDFNASDDQYGVVEMSWTQPAASSATHAVVVRRPDRFAESKDDVEGGEIVFDGDVAPGGATATTDAVEGTWYYAVFAGDGTSWLSGAEDPGNADAGTGLTEGEDNGGSGGNGGNGGDDNGGNGDDGTIKLSTGCGCASDGGAPARSTVGLLAALAGLTLLRRRK